MVHCNLLFGPDKEDVRFQQFRNHLQELFKRRLPHDVPMLLHLASRILAALRMRGHEFSSGRSEEDQAWDMLGERSAYLKEGTRVSMCRFQSISGSLATNLPLWPIHLFETTIVAPDEDFLHGKEFVARFCHQHVTPADEPGEGGASRFCRVVGFHGLGNSAYDRIR